MATYRYERSDYISKPLASQCFFCRPFKNLQTIYESAGSYISKLLAKLNCLPDSKPPGNQVRLENLSESVQCIM
jgi:hypothetical protein